MWIALAQHWPEYCMEAAELGLFMVSACLFGTLLEHPASRACRAFPSALARRGLMGLAMGLTAMALIYSPWGQQSGAHMNPATTLTFWLLGKVAPWDALFYVIAQFLGGAAGEAVAWLLLRDRLSHPSINFIVTTPAPGRRLGAWLGEWTLAFGMMLTVLVAGNHMQVAGYTGVFAGTLVALYITCEAPLSGMSLNPARTFGSALIGRQWNGYWIYATAPLVGMFMAAGVYAASVGSDRVFCAKLDHRNHRRCIFRCRQALAHSRETARHVDASKPCSPARSQGDAVAKRL